MSKHILHDLPFLARIGLSCMIFVLSGGMLAAGRHIINHDHNRDDRPELTLDDFTAAYHGIKTVAPLKSALERGHPDGFPEEERVLLLNWLNSNTISDDFDNLDLGMSAPAEILSEYCLQCHARQATEGNGIGKIIPLEYWDDVSKFAFSRNVEPASLDILTASTHTHAIAIGLLTITSVLLLLMTRWSANFTQWLIAAAGIGLLLDISGQWLARINETFIFAILGGGFLFAAATGLMLLLILLDLWLPTNNGQQTVTSIN